MTATTGLISAYDPNFVFSLKVGTVKGALYKLYKQHTDDTLILATDNYAGPLFVLQTAEDPGIWVGAMLVGHGVFELVASGSIPANSDVTPAASGCVRAATPGDVIIGKSFNKAVDTGERVSVYTGVPTSVSTASLSGAHGESWVRGVISEEITLATDSATTIGAENLFPANSYIRGVVARTTEAVNNRSALIIGLTAGDLDGLVTSGALALTLNATAIGQGALVGTFNTTAATATITTSGGTQNTTGKVRVTVFYEQLIAPTS